MKRICTWVVLLYLALAAFGHVRERSGSLECHCAPECWCKRPGLSLFRWVFPISHRERS